MFEFSTPLLYKGIISLGALISEVKKPDTNFRKVLNYIVLKYLYLNTMN